MHPSRPAIRSLQFSFALILIVTSLAGPAPVAAASTAGQPASEAISKARSASASLERDKAAETPGSPLGADVQPEIAAEGPAAADRASVEESVPQRPATTSYTGWNMIAVSVANACASHKILASANFLATNPASVTWTNITGTIMSLAGCFGPIFRLDPFDPINSAYVLGQNGLWHTSNLQSSPPTWAQVLTEANMRTGTGQSGAFFIEGPMTLSALDNGYVALLAEAGDSIYFGHTSDAPGGPSTWTWSQVSSNGIYTHPGLWVSQNTTQNVYIAYDACWPCNPTLRVSTNGGSTWTQSTITTGAVTNDTPLSWTLSGGRSSRRIG